MTPIAKTLVVIPAYNEAEALPATLADLHDAQPELDVVVIDDGSADDTAAAARSHGAAVVRLPFNLGVGGAVRTGLRYAHDRGYHRTVVFDADGQHDATSITALVAAIDAGADMAVGSRFADPDSDYVTGHGRRRAMRLLSRIVRWSTGRTFTDTTSGFRAFNEDATALLARRYPVEYLADTVEVLVMMCHGGYRVVEVPVTMRPRSTGQPSSRSIKLVIDYLRLLIGITASAWRPRNHKERSS
jgi:glycosyltransferase involved in cell wall biosynthesis